MDYEVLSKEGLKNYLVVQNELKCKDPDESILSSSEVSTKVVNKVFSFYFVIVLNESFSIQERVVLPLNSLLPLRRSTRAVRLKKFHDQIYGDSEFSEYESTNEKVASRYFFY
jgi:hypothetical protein